MGLLIDSLGRQCSICAGSGIVAGAVWTTCLAFDQSGMASGVPRFPHAFMRPCTHARMPELREALEGLEERVTDEVQS